MFLQIYSSETCSITKNIQPSLLFLAPPSVEDNLSGDHPIHHVIRNKLVKKIISNSLIGC
jgi:hypothetical protein